MVFKRFFDHETYDDVFHQGAELFDASSGVDEKSQDRPDRSNLPEMPGPAPESEMNSWVLCHNDDHATLTWQQKSSGTHGTVRTKQTAAGYTIILPNLFVAVR